MGVKMDNSCITLSRNESKDMIINGLKRLVKEQCERITELENNAQMVPVEVSVKELEYMLSDCSTYRTEILRWSEKYPHGLKIVKDRT